MHGSQPGGWWKNIFQAEGMACVKAVALRSGKKARVAGAMEAGRSWGRGQWMGPEATLGCAG